MTPRCGLFGAGSRAPASLRASAAVRLPTGLSGLILRGGRSKAWPGLATRQSRLRDRCSREQGWTDSQMLDTARSLPISRPRVLSSNSYEGWQTGCADFDDRTSWRDASHGPVGRSGRSAPPSDACPDRALFAQVCTSRFMESSTRLKASTIWPIHAALAPNSPDGSRPPAKVTLQNAVDLLALAAPCLDHQINSSAAMLRLVTTPKHRACTSLCWTVHGGERKLDLPLHSRQRLFGINRSLRSYQPILRAVDWSALGQLGTRFTSAHC